MNKETIDCQVVMLPNLERNLPEHRWGEWKITLDNTKLDYKQYVHSTGLDVYQHLYFTSNEEIKEGDWYYNTTDDKIDTTKWAHILTLINQHPKAEKIVASTDPSLGLPAIPESFLKQYVAVNGKIDKVKLQRVDVNFDKHIIGSGSPKPKYVLELTAANEVVVVKQSESDKGYEKFLNNPEEYIEKTRNSPEDKETVEQAALDYATAITLEPQDSQEYFSFMAGAEWQEQQIANEAIEFANWILGEASHEWNKRAKLPLEEAHKELYELWKKTKE